MGRTKRYFKNQNDKENGYRLLETVGRLREVKSEMGFTYWHSDPRYLVELQEERDQLLNRAASIDLGAAVMVWTNETLTKIDEGNDEGLYDTLEHRANQLVG